MKRFCLLLSVIIILIFMQVLPVYAATPYKGYTYDQWGNAVPAPNGYVPECFLTGDDMGAGFLNNPQDMYVDKYRNNLYIADTGNDRIVAVDENFNYLFEIGQLTTPEGETTGLMGPSGVFVDKDENIYIADTNNARIVKCKKDGQILKIIGAPKNAALGKDFEYIPLKVVVDRDGLLYIQALNVYQGIICVDQDGKFIQFFGSSRVDVTSEVLFQQMLRKFMTREQRTGMISLINTEYSNIYIDEKGFIYAVVSKSQNSLDEIKKLNSKGDNILRVNPYGNSAMYLKNNYGDSPVQYLQDGSMEDTSFIDIHYDETGMISALDSTRGRVFVYDNESNLIFVYGAVGNQLGSFKKPVSIEKFAGRTVVLDSEAEGITCFRLTEFGRNVENAIKLYNDGKYLEAVVPWEKVLEQNLNCNMAYDGLGKAYLRLEKYEEAMEYFRLGYDKTGYSKAQTEFFTQTARENIVLVFVALLAFGAFPFILPWIINTRKNSKVRSRSYANNTRSNERRRWLKC